MPVIAAEGDNFSPLLPPAMPPAEGNLVFFVTLSSALAAERGGVVHGCSPPPIVDIGWGDRLFLSSPLYVRHD